MHEVPAELRAGWLYLSTPVAERLEAAAVACRLHVEPGMYHGADVGPSSSVASMRRFRERMLDAVQAGLWSPPEG